MAKASSVKIKCMFIKSVNLIMLQDYIKFIIFAQIRGKIKHDLYRAADQSQL